MAIENGKKAKEKFIVEYEKELYDITEFIHKHPGKITDNNNILENIFINSIKFKAVQIHFPVQTTKTLTTSLRMQYIQKLLSI